MKLKVNSNAYELPLNCVVSTNGAAVIIDGIITSSSFSVADANPERLVIMFDKERTARWFGNVILDCLLSGQKQLWIKRIDYWDSRFPFGFKYNQINA